MKRLKIPKHLKVRLGEVSKKNDFGSAKDFAEHLLERGLRRYELPESLTTIDDRIESLVDQLGYSSSEEAIEHLLERGLAAYADDKGDEKEFEARLRGLGYID